MCYQKIVITPGTRSPPSRATGCRTSPPSSRAPASRSRAASATTASPTPTVWKGPSPRSSHPRSASSAGRFSKPSGRRVLRSRLLFCAAPDNLRGGSFAKVPKYHSITCFESTKVSKYRSITACSVFLLLTGSGQAVHAAPGIGVYPFLQI